MTNGEETVYNLDFFSSKNKGKIRNCNVLSSLCSVQHITSLWNSKGSAVLFVSRCMRERKQIMIMSIILIRIIKKELLRFKSFNLHVRFNNI